MKLLSLFSGIGSFERALTNIGVDYELVGFSEIDKWAIESYSAIHNVNTNKNLGDVSEIAVEDIPDADLVTYGFPCQDVSVAGQGKGIREGTRSGLLYEAERIIEHVKPKYAIAENVKNLIGKRHREDFDGLLERLSDYGYNNYWEVLNAKDFGVPQNRERVFIVSVRKDIDNGTFEFPIGGDNGVRLKDVLSANVEHKYYIASDRADTLLGRFTKEQLEKQALLGGEQRNQSIKTDGISTTLTSSMGMGGGYVPLRVEDRFKAMESLQERMMHESDAMRYGGLKEELFEVYGVNKKCDRCENQLLLSDLPQYTYLCFECDENMFGFESEPNNQKRLGGLYDDEQRRRQAGAVWDKGGVSPTLCTMQGGHREPSVVESYLEEYSIRKLTPLECWRLMGFEDKDYWIARRRLEEKFYNGGDRSNSQMYKQAGNSIVVDVLEDIFKNLLK